MADRDSTRHASPRTATADRNASALAPGDAFGKYRIERLLGEGAMGTVYLASHVLSRRQFALKIPKFEPGDDEGRARFRREVNLIAALDHPNICRAYDYDEVDGTPFLVMQFIEGRPLSDSCSAGKLLPPRDAAALIRKLAQALAEAHKAGVIHRDLKPSNIMIDTAGEPIVMDFGLARVVGDAGQSRLTQTGTIIGSPAYMSPEQVQGKTSSLGPATDIYSLGVVFYELLTGRLPFDGPIAVVMAKLLTKAAPPPRQFRPDLDPALEAVCLKMMAKKIADRYGSMTEAAQALAVWHDAPHRESPSKPTPSSSGGGGSRKASQTVSKVAPTDAGSVGHGKTRPPAKLSAADAEALHQTARKCLARHDAVEAVRLLEEIPAAQRTEAMSELLQQTQRMLGEITDLNRDIDQALSTSDARVLKPAVKRLLELKPADPRARKLQKVLQQPGGLAKFVASGSAAVTTNDGLLSGMGGTVRAVVAVFLVAFLGMLGWTWHYLKTSGPPTAQAVAANGEAGGADGGSNQRGAGDPASGSSELAGDRYALLVGVQKYANTSGLSELKFADADVEGLANVLKASGVPDKNLVVMTQKRGAENVRFLPTRDNILKELAALLRDRAADDTVIVALAGHGVQFKNDDQSWFCPLDADIGIIRNKAKATLIPLGDVYKDLESSQAGFKLLLCDACRNDPFASSTRRAIVDLQSATRPVQAPPGGVAAFFSCSEGEVAFEDAGLGHGVFFHFIIEGLKGAADLDNDAAVSLPELEGFAKKRVSDHVRSTFNAARQMPQVINNSRGLMTVATVRAKPAPPEIVAKNATANDSTNAPPVNTPPATNPPTATPPATPSVSAKIPADAVVLNGRSYKFFAEKLGFWQAKKRCEEMGGHLPIIRSKAENDVVTSLLRNAFPKRQGFEAVWLGFTDVAKEGDWRWLDNSPRGYTNWGPMQPNDKGGDEDYALLYLARQPGQPDGLWSDQPAESVQHPVYFVCEWDGVPGAAALSDNFRREGRPAARILPVAELNSPHIDAYAWLSPDGLTAYWTLEGTGPSQILMSKRPSVDAVFGRVRTVLDGRHHALTGDQLEMILVGAAGFEQLHVCRRGTADAPFPSPTLIDEFRSFDRPKAPWLSSDGLTILFAQARNVSGGLLISEIFESTRTNRTARWSTPKVLRLPPSIEQPQWPSMTSDGRTLYLSIEGTTPRQSPIVVGHRDSPTSDFRDFRPVTVADKPLTGRAPRHAEAAGELWFSQVVDADGRDWDLLVVKDYVPPFPIVGAAGASAPAVQPPFVELFNGRDLSGWTAISSQGAWKAANGVLTASANKSGKPGGALVTAREYSDFELDLEFRLERDGNSGVFLRLPDAFPPSGADTLEIQLLDDDGPRVKGKVASDQLNGAIYDVVAPNPRVAPSIDAWNRMTIRAVGSKITVTINNVKAVDVDLSQYPQASKNKPHLARRSGKIGLQRHARDVSFRNIRLRDLSEAARL